VRPELGAGRLAAMLLGVTALIHGVMTIGLIGIGHVFLVDIRDPSPLYFNPGLVRVGRPEPG
jgi:hypothetical protein